MELILKQVEKHSLKSNEIAQTIIEELIVHFGHVIKEKNLAMQVNIINLMDIIMNNCNLQGD